MNPIAETNTAGNTRQSTHETTRVAIVGGGPAAVEAMLALSDFGGSRASIDVYSPSGDFKLRPLAVLGPFGDGDVRHFDMKWLTYQSGATFHQRGIRKVDTKLKRVFATDGRSYSYDYAVIATGTKSIWAIPGATTFWGTRDDAGAQEALGRIRSLMDGRLILAIPPGPTWPLPLYELALITAASWTGESQPRLTIVSPESRPLQLFGVRTSQQVDALLARNGIEFIGDTEPESFNGTELFTSGSDLRADEVITLPRLAGRHLEGVPFNKDGFIEVGQFGEVKGADDVFAIGDVTDSKLKFGALATQQADIAAAAIARDAWGMRISKARPREMLTGFLQTGEGPFRISAKGLSKVPAPEVSMVSNRKIYGKLLNPFIEKHGS